VAKAFNRKARKENAAMDAKKNQPQARLCDANFAVKSFVLA